ncbi:MAG TPA: ribonuclease R [Thermosynergistes sp.]|nr:ribonuclease R [Thermosynergistes sp.]
MFSKERLVKHLSSRNYEPSTAEEIASALSVSPEEFRELEKTLKKLEDDGLAFKSRRGRYLWCERNHIVVGRLQVHPQGFAFLMPEKGDLPDIFVPPDQKGDAIHGDRVLVRYHREKGKRLVGSVIKVLQRSTKRIVGTVRAADSAVYVVPLEKRYAFVVALSGESGRVLLPGDVVVCEIARYPTPFEPAFGAIVRRIGKEGERGVDVKALMEHFGVEEDFPEAAWDEAEHLLRKEAAVEAKGRVDFRNWATLTIDPEEAKDFDDAISVEATSDGWHVAVHIADVARYVREGGALDDEAKDRGFSVYLVDRVAPMLPPQLSSNLCSLKEGEDRYTITVDAHLDGEGRVKGCRIVKSVINVDRRLTYEEAQRALDGVLPLEAPFQRTLEEASKLARQLYERRLEDGMLEFDLPEVGVDLDASGYPVAIRVLERRWSYKVIEHLMIMANSLVADHLFSLGVPALYRIHERPNAEKLEQLRALLANLGLRLRALRPRHKDIFELLKLVEGRPQKRLVHTLLLRSLPRARYAPEALPHFGLALKRYLHFTSPIRRYSDLLVHRIISSNLDGVLAQEIDRFRSETASMAAHLSAREEVVDEAERESVRLKLLQYMERHVGDVFSGVISGVVSTGFFVELENSAEGFVHVSSLDDDYYIYDERQMALVGRRRGRIYRLGDPLRVLVAKVDRSMGRLDLEISR